MGKSQNTKLVIKIFPSSPTGIWFSKRLTEFLRNRVYYREFRVSFGKALAVGLFLVILSAWALTSMALAWTSHWEAEKHRERALVSTRALTHAKRDFVTLYARMRPMGERIDRMDSLARKLSILVGADPARIPAFQKSNPPSAAELGEMTELLYARFAEFHTLATDRQFEMDHTPSVSPLRNEFVVTSRFGMRVNRFTARAASGGPEEGLGSTFHSAIDLAAPVGTPIYTSAEGLVTFSGRIPPERSMRGARYGNFVTVDHGSGIVTHYAHCDKLNVLEGQKVRRGELIAWVGNSGRSTGPHLHYEVVVDKTPVNPEWYISDRDLADPDHALETVDLTQRSELSEELDGIGR